MAYGVHLSSLCFWSLAFPSQACGSGLWSPLVQAVFLLSGLHFSSLCFRYLGSTCARETVSLRRPPAGSIPPDSFDSLKKSVKNIIGEVYENDTNGIFKSYILPIPVS